MDWAAFNSDRRYYCRLKESGTYLEDVIRVDRLTLQIALWKMVFSHSPDLKRSLASGCYIGGAYRLNSTALPSLSHPSQAGLMLSRSCPPTTLSTLSAACSSLPSCFLSSSARSANSGLRGNRAAGQKTYPWYKPCAGSQHRSYLPPPKQASALLMQNLCGQFLQHGGLHPAKD